MNQKIKDKDTGISRDAIIIYGMLYTICLTAVTTLVAVFSFHNFVASFPPEVTINATHLPLIFYSAFGVNLQLLMNVAITVIFVGMVLKIILAMLDKLKENVENGVEND